MNQRNALEEWLEAQKLDQAGFARLSGLPPPMISLWLNGKRRPGLDNAFAIERATGGAVPASYWTTLPPVPRQDAESADESSTEQA